MGAFARMSPAPASVEYCDVVMKGGVTSGIVYPPAISELAKRFAFRNIGGTSIGAVAAGLAAAAELGRRKQIDGTFARLAAIPEELSASGAIVRLMAPDTSAKPVFAPLSAALFEGREMRPAILLGIWRAIRHFGFNAGVIALAVPLAALAIRAAGWASGWGLWLFVVPLMLGVFAAVAALSYGSAFLAVIRENRFGMISAHRESDAGEERFIDWLGRQLQELSGLPKDTPLTFGHLADAPRRGEPIPTGVPVINLELIGTNITHGSAYRIPFKKEETFYYDPAEWSSLFDADVLSWIERHPKADTPPAVNEKGVTLRALPAAENFPVLVAARLSLGVPLLFTAVPVYNVDLTRRNHRDFAEGKKLNGPLLAEQCWFVDGGLCANFPIHLFDAPIPRWPTFGINLKQPHPEYNTEPEMVWLPSNDEPYPAVWNRCDEKTPLAMLKWFVEALVSTATGWRDSLQTTMPGFRDRVVHISQRQNEGGFNLGMEPRIVERLACRGTVAGRKLRDDFGWDLHVWIRLRSHLAAQEKCAVAFSRTFAKLKDISAAAAAALSRPPSAPPRYPWDKTKQDLALDAVDQLGKTFLFLEGQQDALQDGSPEPRAPLRITPEA
jgi:predicted acylesterase/phospholipase RssA